MDMQGKDAVAADRERQESLRVRRVGSVTFGLTLILFGILFLLHMALPSLDYEVIFHFWPVVFILLGVEILVENHKSGTPGCKFVYDFPAILMLVLMLLFAMMMAAVDISIQYYQDIWW